MRNSASKTDIPQDTDAMVEAKRMHWMGTLARAATADLEFYWRTHGQGTGYNLLRQPECGLVMVRGRAGGSGKRFNLGEMTVTRCSIQLHNGTVGHAYIAGRNRRHAELAAVFDALLQIPSRHDEIKFQVIAPLVMKYLAVRNERSRKAAATKVDFFTMVRGEDE